MITLIYENDNPVTQDTYDNIMSQIDLLTLECPSCHHTGNLIKHAKYNRTFRVSDSIITIKIVRVLCKECGHTHAILLCDFVPYSQILIDDQLDIMNDQGNEISSIKEVELKKFYERVGNYILQNYKRSEYIENKVNHNQKIDITKRTKKQKYHKRKYINEKKVKSYIHSIANE